MLVIDLYGVITVVSPGIQHSEVGVGTIRVYEAS